jgi:NAD-dependent DNA ligase
VGEDVTANVAHHCRHSADQLSGKCTRLVFEVRGEVYMAKADFEALNARQPKRRSGQGTAIRQPAQRRRRIAAPEGRQRNRQRARCASSRTAGARRARAFREANMR